MNGLAKFIAPTLLVPCLFIFDVVADEHDALRLFHKPLATEAIADQSNQSPVLPDEALKDAPRLIKKRAVIPSYRYDGFMSNEVGRYYIVNGVNLSEIENLALVFVSNSGRTLKLRTANGYVFTLAIGEIVSVDPNLASRNNE